MYIVSKRLILSLTIFRLNSYGLNPDWGTAFLQDHKHIYVKREKSSGFQMHLLLLALAVGLGPCTLRHAVFIHPNMSLQHRRVVGAWQQWLPTAQLGGFVGGLSTDCLRGKYRHGKQGFGNTEYPRAPPQVYRLGNCGYYCYPCEDSLILT